MKQSRTSKEKLNVENTSTAELNQPFYSPESMRQILQTASDMRTDLDKALEIYICTGLRLSEGLALQFEDVIWPLRAIVLPAHRSKTLTKRVIPLTGRCFELLQYMRKKYSKPIPFNHDTLTKDFKPLARRTGDPGTIHSLRATTLAYLKDFGGINDFCSEIMLGHHNVRDGHPEYSVDYTTPSFRESL